ncbi:MAG: hypothetical protein FD161_3472 [Limisphaerales bacterium]|nr:MAG: hypothetical protein FD161_3472 [Limisphaerales bacterium]KAG0507690.1 MAG: hypothetical protein E1N63_3138 [Limisphaerales bacterium]TXT52438.1 MAG: hypothetical protein FD140_662 [Limisphaerales bacterium]
MNNMSLPLASDLETPTAPRRLPLAVKLGFTAFMAVLVPVYWTNYGPTNFLYFCDVALFLTLAAVWTESALLASMAAVGIVLPQLVWVLDFAAGLCGVKLLGMTAYMFDERRSLFLRGLSLFHGWLPFLLLFLVRRLGYDRRAFSAWWALAWMLVLFCYCFMPAPTPDAGAEPVNINYVHGMSDDAAQTWMPPLAWLATLMAGLPALLYFPTHLALKKWWPRAEA